MGRPLLLVALAALGLGAAHPVGRPQPQSLAGAEAACSRVWVGREAEIEQALRTGRVARTEEVPIGVTKPRRAYLAPPSPAARFAWKPIIPGYRQGFMESYKAEIAAYKLDVLLDLHMVPPIVERKLDGLTGAAVYWIENVRGWDVKQPPSGPEPAWSHQLARMKMFDLFIGNIDRNQGNLVYDADYHLFLIDHSRAFIGKKDLKGLSPLGTVDRALWARMTALGFDDLKAALGAWVGDGDLRAMLVRRERMAEAIAALVKQRGAGSVFFD